MGEGILGLNSDKKIIISPPLLWVYFVSNKVCCDIVKQYLDFLLNVSLQLLNLLSVSLLASCQLRNKRFFLLLLAAKFT
jgi:hypothetical protein